MTRPTRGGSKREKDEPAPEMKNAQQLREGKEWLVKKKEREDAYCEGGGQRS